MYIVVTTVEVQPGSVDRLAKLFDSTNRDLVAGHDDWLAAYFTANRSTNTVTVIAHWRQAASYEMLRSSAEFQSTMAKFAESFVGPPRVSVNEVLVEM
jgi:quinol monooxygenase YgiN